MKRKIDSAQAKHSDQVYGIKELQIGGKEGSSPQAIIVKRMQHSSDSCMGEVIRVALRILRNEKVSSRRDSAGSTHAPAGKQHKTARKSH